MAKARRKKRRAPRAFGYFAEERVITSPRLPNDLPFPQGEGVLTSQMKSCGSCEADGKG